MAYCDVSVTAVLLISVDDSDVNVGDALIGTGNCLYPFLLPSLTL
jgi:hypothetical protein